MVGEQSNRSYQVREHGRGQEVRRRPRANKGARTDGSFVRQRNGKNCLKKTFTSKLLLLFFSLFCQEFSNCPTKLDSEIEKFKP